MYWSSLIFLINLHSSMKNAFRYLLLALVFATTFSDGVSAQFRQGTNILGVGLGFGGYGGVNRSGLAFNTGIPIGVQWEIGVSPKLGVGYFGVGALGGVYFFTGGSFVVAGAQGNYHFDIPTAKNLDLFAGLNLLFAFNEFASGAGLGLNIGARYFFTPNIAGFLRLGYGFGFAMIGVDFGL